MSSTKIAEIRARVARINASVTIVQLPGFGQLLQAECRYIVDAEGRCSRGQTIARLIVDCNLLVLL